VIYRDKPSSCIHIALVHGTPTEDQETLVRVHEPVTVLDFLDAKVSNHSWPLVQALQQIAGSKAGVAVLLNASGIAAPNDGDWLAQFQKLNGVKTENSAPAEILVSTAPAKLNTTNLFSNWDGSWPTLVRALSVRGVAQQLASQSELLACEPEGNVVMMRLRVPVDTLLSAGSADKLSVALTEYLGKTIKLVTEIGTVAHTAHAQVVAEQATRQQEAEDAMHNDPFVQTLIKEFGGTIVPGSIKPA
jgi:hypothetical protein